MRTTFLFIICFLCFLFPGTDSFAAETGKQAAESQAIEDMEGSLEQYDFGDIEQYLSDQRDALGWDFSFKGLMKDLMAGNFMEVAKRLLDGLKNSLFSEIRYNGGMMVQIIVLGMIGAMFTNFSSVFNGSQISESGFFVTYLLMFTFLASSFFSSIQVANQVLSQIMDFMKVLLPSYFLAAAFSGGSISALAGYEFTMLIITVVQWLFFKLLIPMVRVYVLLVLADHISKEDLLSKLTELLKQGIQWTVKTLLGVVLGFQLIQGMVLPYVDSMKNTSVQKLLQVIPGIGQGINAVTQVVIGSGVLIKNTMGAAAILILLLITAIPVIKLVVLMLLYQCVAAGLQPVCDKRLISCISGVAQGHKLLLGIVLSGLFLFVITIAMVCSSTNITYYTG